MKSTSTGLILQAGEGERVVRRWGSPTVIKVDPQHGHSKKLVVFTEEVAPGTAIPLHKHDTEEVILLQRGEATAIVGDKRKQVTTGATIYVPEGTWHGLENSSGDPVSVMGIFVTPGYDKYLRATSVPEGQAVKSLSTEETVAIRLQFRGTIPFKEE